MAATVVNSNLYLSLNLNLSLILNLNLPLSDYSALHISWNLYSHEVQYCRRHVDNPHPFLTACLLDFRAGHHKNAVRIMVGVIRTRIIFKSKNRTEANAAYRTP